MTDDVVVRRLRIRIPASAASEAIGLRLRAEDLLRDVVTSFARDAGEVLVIRRLTLPTGRTATARRNDPVRSIPARWAASAPEVGRGQLDQTPMVRFPDMARFLAHHARDVLAGDLGRHWWWGQSGVGATGGADGPGYTGPSGASAPGDILASAWVRYPAAVPAAVAELSGPEREAVLLLLDEANCALVTRAVKQTFRFPAPRREASETGGADRPRPSPGAPATVPPASTIGRTARARSELLDLLLGLSRRPARTRHPGGGEQTPPRSLPAGAGRGTAPAAEGRVVGPSHRPPAPAGPGPVPRSSGDGEPAQPAQPAQPAGAQVPPEFEGTPTALAGIFCLPNLLDEPELELDEFLLALDGWGTVEAMARCLHDTLPTDLGNEDAAWPLLADLAGRPRDHPLGGDESEPGPAVAAWLIPRLDALRVRLLDLLARRLRLPVRLVADEFLRRPGVVVVSRTHVDVVCAMNAVSLPVRRAALDRDPGWVPDLGRIVTLHYR